MSKQISGVPWTARQTERMAVPGYRPVGGQVRVKDPAVVRSLPDGRTHTYTVPELCDRAGFDPVAAHALLHVVAWGYSELNSAKAMLDRTGTDPDDAGGVSEAVVLHVLASLYYELMQGVQHSLDAEATGYHGPRMEQARVLYLACGLGEEGRFWTSLLRMGLRAVDYERVFEHGSPLTKRLRRLLTAWDPDERSGEHEAAIDDERTGFADYQRFVFQCAEALEAANRALIDVSNRAVGAAHKLPLDRVEMARLVHQALVFRCREGDWRGQLARLSPTGVDQRVAAYLLHQVAGIDLSDVQADSAGQDEIRRWQVDAKARPVHDTNGLLSLVLWALGFRFNGAPYNANSLSSYATRFVPDTLAKLGVATTWRWGRDLPRSAEEWMP